jgi:hydrogenase expression/formation protein HypC
MCLAVPGKILETKEENGSRFGRVQFGGIARMIQLDFVPEAVVGDYVIVHVGFALNKVNAEEAERTYQLLEEMGMLDAGELTADAVPGFGPEPAALKGDATPHESPERSPSTALPEGDRRG